MRDFQSKKASVLIALLLFSFIFFVQFCFAIEESNFSEGNYTSSILILSNSEKIVWGLIIILILVLLIALFVLAYLLSKLNLNRIVSRNLSGAEEAIAKKSVERAKRLS